MVEARCVVCNITGYGDTYEQAAENIKCENGKSKGRPCGGGPAKKVLYIDSEGNGSWKIPTLKKVDTKTIETKQTSKKTKKSK